MNNKQYDHRLGSGLIGRILMWLWLIFTTVLNGQTGSVLMDQHLKLEIQSTNNKQDLNVLWPSDVGTIYQVQSAARLYENTWTNVGMPITAAEDITTFPIRTSLFPQQYYRVAKTAAILFKDDFETGNANAWTFYPGEPGVTGGWQVEAESSGNHVLRSSGHYWAGLAQNFAWSDFRLRVRVQLRTSAIHICFRRKIQGSYFIWFSPSGAILSKQLSPDFTSVASSSTPNALGIWHAVEIIGEGGNLRVLVDGEERINYNDPEPITSGSIAFEAFLDSSVYIDDVTVTGPPPRPPDPRFTWVRTGGPPGGVGYDVRIDPTNPQTLYVTDAFSGVSKSENGGALWKPMNNGITSRTGSTGDAIPVFCLTIDPRNPKVIWVGTQNMRGIYKSTDGGQNWVKSDNGVPDLPFITFRSFTIDPLDSNIVYAGAELPTNRITPDGQNPVGGKIFRTLDGGKNWTEILDCGALVRWMAIDPTDTRILYAATGIFDRCNVRPEGVLKSIDGGKTWKNINNGLTNLVVGGLVMDPRNPKVLYAATGQHDGFGGGPMATFGGVYVTRDGGQLWDEILHGPNAAFVPSAITLAPSNPDIVYVVEGITFYRSRDAGKSWTSYITAPRGGHIGIPIAVTSDPKNPDVIYINSYVGGVFKSIDGGETWNISSEGYTGAWINYVGMDPQHPEIVYAVGGLGIAKSIDAGQGWAYVNPKHEVPPVSSLSINPLNAQNVIASTGYSGLILRTTDGGESWTTVFNPMLPLRYFENLHSVVQFARFSGNADIIYAAGRSAEATAALNRFTKSLGVLKSTDDGAHWEFVTNGLIADLNINTVAIHPSNPNIVYAGTLNGGIYQTSDAGAYWQAIGGNFAMDIRSIAIDPVNPKILYAGTEGSGVFRSTDGGLTWKHGGIGLDPNATIRSIVIDPTNPANVWAADNRSGVYRSTDRGDTWSIANDGLSMRAVNILTISADGKVLYVATSGGGVYRLGLNTP